MKLGHQNYLTKELQRLLSQLNCGTGLYNVECRVCKNGKPYIMEVSPRAGGNRIAELQRIGTGIDLIESEVSKAIGEPLSAIDMPHYDAIYVNDILHSKTDGVFMGVEYDMEFKKKHVLNEAIYPLIGSLINSFKGANDAIGSIFLRFQNRKETNDYINNRNQIVKVKTC